MKTIWKILMCLMFASGSLVAADVRTCDYVTQQAVQVGGFWRDQFRKLTVEWLPHCIRQMEKGGRGEELLNLVATGEINAGKKPSVRFKGCPWSDAYPYNTVEALCLALEIDPGNDPAWRDAQTFLRAKLESWIPIILAAQEPSGYIHSYHALRRIPHFSQVDNHEFYVMGYFIEMGIAHMRLTHGRDRRLFDAAIRCADHIDGLFGPAPKRTWINGCPGIEYAFLRLADARARWDGAGTGARYVRLAHHFITHQHELAQTAKLAHPFGIIYNQSDRPAAEMREAAGHAVRACYFYTGMAGLAGRLGDTALGLASDRIFANAIDCKGYLTGGVGANEHGEAFGPNYWLPLNGYCEACAACAMDFWCRERETSGRGGLRAEDVRERLLYNAVLGSISHDGRNFLYRNPPNGSERFYPWHGCPCCIGNIPRTLFALKDTLYTFARDGRTLWVNQFMASESDVTLGGKKYRVKMSTTYPNGGGVTLTITPAPTFAVVVRLPNRTESKLYTATPTVEHGSRLLRPVHVDASAATYAWTLPLPLQRVTADPRVEACRGRVAYQRGPIVYSWEGPHGDLCVPNYDRLRDGGFSAVWKRTAPLAPIGRCALHTWNSSAEFRDITVTDKNGQLLWQGLPDPATSEKAAGGTWVRDGEVLRQTNTKSIHTQLWFGDPQWHDYTIRFQARMLKGENGFIVHVRDESLARVIWANLGGWGNTQHAIEAFGYTCYAKEVVTQPGKTEMDRWYTVEIICRGDTVAVTLDGKPLFVPVAIPHNAFD